MKWAASFLIAAIVAPVAAAQDGVGEQVRRRVETIVRGQPLRIGGEPVRAGAAIQSLYESRGFAPIWIEDGRPIDPARDVLAAIRNAGRDGLRPRDYHADRIAALLDAARNEAALADVEILLSDAFLLLGSHNLMGRVNPETLHAEWVANRRQADLAAVLLEAAATGRYRETLDGLLPPQEGYARLRDALALYRKLADEGGWPAIPDGPTLRRGDVDPRVGLVRRRLRATGDLAGADGPGSAESFDEEVESAVVRFQERHGLDADGAVGKGTRAALSVSAAERARQIELNLERWRWLPQDLGARRIVVNIGDFTLVVFEGDRPVLSMRVVTGRPYRRTPVFSDTMTYLVLSPFWNVPPSIAVKDKLPEIRKDPGYVAKNRMKLLQGWGVDEREVDPATVDWQAMTPARFNAAYRLRQEPGPDNALGDVKFMFPNKFNVYLHDTPARDLFAKTSRGFSSGCIRLQQPIELASYLLRDDPAWSREAILRAIERREEKTVRLPRPIPVHIQYWTAWVDADGRVQFRPDIYDRDPVLDAALRENG